MSRRFKVGDRVRSIVHGKNYRGGQLGTVGGYNASGHVLVRFDDPEHDRTQIYRLGWYESSWELADEADSFEQDLDL